MFSVVTANIVQGKLPRNYKPTGELYNHGHRSEVSVCTVFANITFSPRNKPCDWSV